MKIVFIIALLTCGCASVPYGPIKQNQNLGGYSEAKVTSGSYLVDFFGDEDFEKLKSHLIKRSAELCKIDGYEYFNIPDLQPSTNEKYPGVPGAVCQVVCFKTKTIKSLGLKFTQRKSYYTLVNGIREYADAIIVTEIPAGIKTPFQVRDILISVDGKRIELEQDLLTYLRDTQDNVVQITYYRNGVKYLIEAPVQQAKAQYIVE
jgi:hypothetical protein